MTEERETTMKRTILAMGFAVALGAATGAYADTQKKAAAAHAEEAPQVTVEELKKLVDTKGATIVDANGTKMYEEGHVPGALSFAANEGKLSSVLPKDKAALIVAYCGGPLCSAWEEAAKEAKAAGYTNIKHFKGGIKGWKDAGMPVEAGVKKSS
jgi:rhodanese-related sulfurtransferase